jgi:MULE transposase domain
VYEELFRELRQSMEDNFGSIGAPKIVMMDQELAAHNAVSTIFPEYTTRSCFFHFTQNIVKWIRSHGLATMLSNAVFNKWLDEIFGKEVGFSICNLTFLA